MHWAPLEASAVGGLVASCPTWKRRENSQMVQVRAIVTMAD